MIVKKPTIVIYSCHADADILKEVCAGIEEEGVLYEVSCASDGTVSSLSALASDASVLGVGIGIVGKQLSLHIKGMNVHSGEDEKTALLSYTAPNADTARALGSNSARVIKKLPLRLPD